MFPVLVLAAGHVGPESAYPPPGIGRWDATITQENIKTTICTTGYTTLVRTGKTPGFGPITQKIKDEVYARDGKKPDGLPPGQSHCCEIDHAYPLTDGGANVIDNLWAESWDKPYGAREKDHSAEDKLNALICSGKMTLKDAQDCLANDWIACAARIKSIK